MKKSEYQQEALSRARNGEALSNLPAIFRGFIAKGIPEEEIQPRINVFTLPAWNALGKRVKAGEHGVKVLTYIEGEKETNEVKEDGSPKIIHWRSPKATEVFHISQVQ